MQLRRLAAMERQKIIEEHDRLEQEIADYKEILASPQRQRDIVGTELEELVEKYGDERRTTIVPFDGDMSMEDQIGRASCRERGWMPGLGIESRTNSTN